MGRIWFFIREAARALRRNAAPSVAAIVTTVVTVVLLGVLIPIFQVAQSKSAEVRNQLELKAFLYDDATQGEINALQTKIEGLPHVKSVVFVSKADALKILSGRLKDPNVLKELHSNPLPASFNIKPDDAANLDAVHQELTPPDASGTPRPISPIIETVKDSRQEAQKIEQVTSSLKIVLTILTALLVAASLMLVGNTIRLSIYARRREVEVMRLVGATRWFIRWPFMIEGMVVGFVGGVAAILILWLGKVTIVDPLSDSPLFSALNTMSFPLLVGILFCSAIVVSAIGSGITLRRFLRV
ncbi:MAG: permease-like cell division protein FtsX [Actinomycetota bacterium]|nr:permease-like cell division protein FtsX [Actinomycetota bacterium]